MDKKESIIRQQLRSFINGNRSVSVVKALRGALLIQKDTANGGWMLSVKGQAAELDLATNDTAS